MGVLAEYVRNEAEQLRKEVVRRDAAVQEWKSAVDKLYAQLEQWVTEADDKQGLLIACQARLVACQEPRLGVYEIPSLLIGIGTRRAEVVPHARHVVATIQPPGKEPRRADGMVELTDKGGADYYLFRLLEDGQDAWFIRSVALWNLDPRNATVDRLSRDNFEAAILSILK